MEVPAIRCAELVRAGSGKVWQALSERDGWESWFCNRVLMDFRAGGFIHFRWKDFGPDHYTDDNRAEIHEIVERRKLVFSWQSHETHPVTQVTISLEPRGPITVVRVEETGWNANVQEALTNAAGWGACLGWLKFWVEHGIRFDGRVPERKTRPSKTRR